MDRQISQLPLDAVAELLRLGLGPVQVNDHVPQVAQAGFRVVLLLPGAVGGGARGQVQHGKGEDVGHTVHLPLLPVDLPDALVVGEEHVHPAGDLHPLRLQRGGNHPGQEGLVGVGAGKLPVNVNVVRIHLSVSPFFCFRRPRRP